MKTVSISVRKEFLDRHVCRREAKRLISEGLIAGMSEMQLAHEIYVHALAYYFCEKTGLFPMIKKHADPIDLRDGGDPVLRKSIYAALWYLPGKWSDKM